MRRGLYAIVDADALGERDPLAFARRLLTHGPLFALQLRAKRWSASQTLRAARSLAHLCAQRETPFFVNDRPDVALLAGSFGVHVGQDDLSPSEVNSIAPDLRVGYSTHSVEQATAALSFPLHYVALGPVYATDSKHNPDPVVGLDTLRTVVERAGATPVVAIGGITLARAAEVCATGAAAGAVIAALTRVPDDELAFTARSFHLALGGV